MAPGSMSFFLAGLLVGALACGAIVSLWARHRLRKILPAEFSPAHEGFSATLDRYRQLIDRYQTLIDNLAAAVIIRNPSGKVTYCSPYTEVLTGYSLNEIYDAANDFFGSIVHESDRERYERATKIVGSGEAFHFRYRFYHKSGIDMWAEVRTVPVTDAAGAILYSLSVVIDVTGMVRYQHQVEEKNRDLQDFAYMVSHDLKAPLVTIKGMLGILKDDLKPVLSADSAETMRHIDRAVIKLEQLVMSVLEYSRISVQEIGSGQVALDQVMRDALDDYSAQIKSMGASITIQQGLPTVLGEQLKLYQVFGNLIGNALKYYDPSRPLTLSIREIPTRSTRLVSIAVEDNGIGIPSEKRDSIFRPFQRAHPGRVEGLGIGLASVKKLLDKLGGHIEVESVEGKGSVFKVTLRRAEATIAKNIAAA